MLAFKGGYLTFAGQPKAAVADLEQAIQLNPNAVTYRVMLARVLTYTGRPAEALVQMDTALRLSPRDPLMPLFANDLSAIHYALGHYVEAESWARRSVGVFARLGLAIAIAAQGRLDEARQVVREMLVEAPDMTLETYEHGGRWWRGELPRSYFILQSNRGVRLEVYVVAMLEWTLSAVED